MNAFADVTGRHMFYNNSAFDGRSTAADSPDYDAVAAAAPAFGHGHSGALDEPAKDVGKQALLPGQFAAGTACGERRR